MWLRESHYRTDSLRREKSIQNRELKQSGIYRWGKGKVNTGQIALISTRLVKGKSLQDG